MFTQYQFSPSAISELAAASAKAYLSQGGEGDPLTFAASIIAKRLRAKPASYLQYGPYWWAVKRVLRLVEDFGDADDATIRAAYGEAFPPYARLVAAEKFRDYYAATFLAGTSRFDLDADGEESYELYDTDMEIRRAGAKHPLRVAADMQAVVEDEPATVVLDGVAATASAGTTPFAVRFDYGTDVWTAHVYAPNRAAAAKMVNGMNDRLGRAIDFARAAGDAVLDSSNYSQPLYVDTAKRTVSEMAPTGQLARS